MPINVSDDFESVLLSYKHKKKIKILKRRLKIVVLSVLLILNVAFINFNSYLHIEDSKKVNSTLKVNTTKLKTFNKSKNTSVTKHAKSRSSSDTHKKILLIFKNINRKLKLSSSQKKYIAPQQHNLPNIYVISIHHTYALVKINDKTYLVYSGSKIGRYSIYEVGINFVIVDYEGRQYVLR